MKKLLALTLVAGSAIAMASTVTACSKEVKTVTDTQYFLGHGAKDNAGHFTNISIPTQNDYYNVIKVDVVVEGGVIKTADVNESTGYIKASTNSVTIADTAKAVQVALEDADYEAFKSEGGDLSFNTKLLAHYKIANTAATALPTDATELAAAVTAYKAHASYATDLAAFKAAFKKGESSRYVYDLVAVHPDKVANIVDSTKTETVGFIGKTNDNYGSSKFKYEQVQSTVKALFADKSCSDIEGYKFDTRVKAVANIPSTDTAIAGATASESTLYAAAINKVVKAACAL